jgi:hypothetical protein
VSEIDVGSALNTVADRTNRFGGCNDLQAAVAALRAGTELTMKNLHTLESRLHVHRVTTVGEVEVLLLLLSAAGAKAEVTLLVDLGTGLAHVLSLTLLI